MSTKTELTTGIAPITAIQPVPVPVPVPVPDSEKPDQYAGTGTSSPITPTAPAQQPAALRAAQVTALAKLGYPLNVANQLTLSYPNIAAEILALAKAGTKIPKVGGDKWSYYYPGENAWEPVTLYRGINAEVIESDRTATTKKLPSKLSFNFFSDALGYPIMRSLWHAEAYGPQPAGRTRGVITECVVPKYLVFRDYHPQLYADATNTSIGGTHPVVLMDMAPDLLAFTKRVGVIPYTNENKRKDDLRDESIIEWKPDGVLDGFIVSKTPREKAVEVYVDKPSRWLDTPQPRDYVAFISAPGVHIGWT